MLAATVWRKLLGVDRATVIESIDFDEEAESVVVRVRARRSSKRRCGVCGRRAPGYDQGEGRLNWRALDLGGLVCYLQSDAPRVNCPEHGPRVAQVPWARHGAGHTPDFDDQVAWLVTHTAKSAVSELLRVAWRTVGSPITGVVADARAAHDPFDGLTRSGDRRDQLSPGSFPTSPRSRTTTPASSSGAMRAKTQPPWRRPRCTTCRTHSSSRPTPRSGSCTAWPSSSPSPSA